MKIQLDIHKRYFFLIALFIGFIFGGVVVYAQVAGESHEWNELNSVPAQASRWPSWSEITGKPVGFADGVDNTGLSSVSWGSISGRPSGLNDGDHIERVYSGFIGSHYGGGDVNFLVRRTPAGGIQTRVISWARPTTTVNCGNTDSGWSSSGSYNHNVRVGNWHCHQANSYILITVSMNSDRAIFSWSSSYATPSSGKFYLSTKA